MCAFGKKLNFVMIVVTLLLFSIGLYLILGGCSHKSSFPFLLGYQYVFNCGIISAYSVVMCIPSIKLYCMVFHTLLSKQHNYKTKGKVRHYTAY